MSGRLIVFEAFVRLVFNIFTHCMFKFLWPIFTCFFNLKTKEYINTDFISVSPNNSSTNLAQKVAQRTLYYKCLHFLQ